METGPSSAACSGEQFYAASLDTFLKKSILLFCKTP